MRVLQAMASPAEYGAEKMFDRLVPALHEIGIEQVAAIRRYPPRSAALRHDGIKVEELKFGGGAYEKMVSRYKLARLIRKTRPDIVMTWMPRASDYCPRGTHIQIGRLGNYFNLKHFRRCHHLVLNTKKTLEHVLNNGWPRERAHYISNFVDERRTVGLSREEIATPDEVPLLVALGRLSPEKAFDILIAAMVRLPDAWLWIAGDGYLAEDFKGLADELGITERIRFLGHRTDVPSILAAADVLVVPSRHETLSNVILEGWAHGVPVVAAAAQGPSELITNNETGMLVPIDDPEALASAISDVLADQKFATALADNGFVRYSANFSRRKIVAEYAALFDLAVN